MAALGRFVQQGKEKLCLIRPKGDALALETLFLAADVYSQAEIEEAVEETAVKPRLALAQQVIDSLSGDFDPSELQSDYRRDLKALLEAKLAGEEIAVAGAGGGGADGRPDGGAPPQRRGGQVGQAAANGAAKKKAAPKAGARKKTAARADLKIRPPRGFRSRP